MAVLYSPLLAHSRPKRLHSDAPTSRASLSTVVTSSPQGRKALPNPNRPSLVPVPDHILSPARLGPSASAFATVLRTPAGDPACAPPAHLPPPVDRRRRPAPSAALRAARGRRAAGASSRCFSTPCFPVMEWLLQILICLVLLLQTAMVLPRGHLFTLARRF